jgi:putative MATE family efflux protein
MILVEEGLTLKPHQPLAIQQYFITDKVFYRRALALIIPVALQYCISMGVNMMDTIMVGRLGEVAISATSLANQFYTIFTFLCMGISAAGLVLSAQYWGAGDAKTVHRVFDILIQIIVLFSALFALLSAIIPEQLMRIYTDDAEVIRAGASYLRVTALIYLPHGISLVISNVIRTVGNAKLGLFTSILSFFVNIFFNYVFIFGKLGFPAMGVTGAALGTLCARAVEFVVCFVYMAKFEPQLHYRLSGLLKPPARALLGEFRRLGLPAIISDTILALAATAISVILGHMGREVVSAYAIVAVIERFCTVAAAGVSSASGVLVGQTVGSGDFARAKKEGASFTLMSAGIGLVAMVLTYFVGSWSIGLYKIADSTVAIAREMIGASALLITFQTVQSTLSKGVLRGGGDTRFLMVADVLFQWCASIPLGFVVGLVLHLPPFWVLIALRTDYVIKTVWLLFRLKSGKWIHQVQPAAKWSAAEIALVE